MSIKLTKLPDHAQVIADTDMLSRFCIRATQAPFIVVDTEFMRESTYWPTLCLIQIAIGGKFRQGEDDCEMSAIIDPLVDGGLDLSPLYQLFSNKNVLKVFHAARQDLEIFHHESGSLPYPVFDTQIAAMVCGFGDSIGYENLLQKMAGTIIDKSARYTDWSIRPLTKRQIDYALADVVFLVPIFEKLRDQLEKCGRSNWIDEEMDELLNENVYDVDPMLTFRRIKSRNAKPRTLSILRELAAWRELKARCLNLPRGRVLRDENILEIAHNAPNTLEGLLRTRGVGKRFIHGNRGREILEAIERGLAVPERNCPKPTRKPDLPNGIGATADLLKVMLKMKCTKFEVAQKIVASSDDLDQIAAFGEKADVPALRSWRYEIFGLDALRLRNGQCAFALEGRNLCLIDVPNWESK